MATLKFTNDWWTAPADGEKGELIMVTGRRDMQPVIATGKYNIRVEVTWRYTPIASGMPDDELAKMLERVTDAFNSTFDEKKPITFMTGIYTGAGERNWVFYTSSLNIFQSQINRALADFELLPIEVSAENDSDWCEYREMCEQCEIMKGE